MLSFSGVTFCSVIFFPVHVFVLMRSLKPPSFIQTFFDVHAPRQLQHEVTQQLSASFFVFVSFIFDLFGDVTFSEYFYATTVFSLFGEYDVRSIPYGWCCSTL